MFFRPLVRAVRGFYPALSISLSLTVAAVGANNAGFFAEEARNLASRPYEPGFVPPTEFAKSLNYDAIRRISAKRQSWIFSQSAGNLQVEPRLAASFNSRGIRLDVLKEGSLTAIPFQAEMFSFPQDIPIPGEGMLPGFGGFRVRGPAREGGGAYEQFSFGGASYFRGHPEGLNYGLSARGLILRKDGKEEFPIFERFAFEEPGAKSSELVWHALLNGPSATGAFRFVSKPGNPHAMEVSAEIFVRSGLNWNDLGLGLAGYSSMYWFSPASLQRTADFRERVHDSEALAVSSSSGERLWRVLSNPKRLKHSSFAVDGLRGFGLIQRDRSFASYEDETARYERRTSAWVEPISGMEAGEVRLMEIPTRGEYDDNMVAYFAPKTMPSAGDPLRVAYRLSWCDDVPSTAEPELARIGQTRAGVLPDKSGITLLTVDFDYKGGIKTLIPEVTIPDGVEKRFAYLKTLPDGRGTRLHIGVVPKLPLPDGNAEFRAVLKQDNKSISETWVYPASILADAAPAK